MELPMSTATPHPLLGAIVEFTNTWRTGWPKQKGLVTDVVGNRSLIINQEFDVEINVQFHSDGYRCTVWTSETYDGDNLVLLGRDDLPAAESAVAAVNAWISALRERSKAYGSP